MSFPQVHLAHFRAPKTTIAAVSAPMTNLLEAIRELNSTV